MSELTLVEINVRDLKSRMIDHGVKVLRCRKHGYGAIISIVRSDKNEALFNSFASENSLIRLDRNAVQVTCSGPDYLDYGTCYKAKSH